MNMLQSQIERLYAAGALAGAAATEARQTFQQFRDALTRGAIRAAPTSGGGWHVHAWVTPGILRGFRLGELVEMGVEDTLSFVDKGTYPPRHFKIPDKVRVVPGGSSVRTGAYIAPGVICMPPMYVNVGAYVDEGTMIDSHALVG